MKKIGLTGTIGSGKTTVSLLLKRKGYSVFNSDGYSRILYQTTNPCYEKVVKAFGEGILDEFGEIDRKALAAIVFSDEEARLRLNAIVHPAVLEGMRSFFAHHPDEDLVFAEVPLLYDAHLEGEFDKVLVVTCSKENAVKRMMEDRGYREAEAIARYETQMNAVDQVKLADAVLYNDGSIRELDEALDEVLDRLEETV